MKKIILFIVCLICITPQSFAIDLSKTFNYGGLTINYPKSYEVSEKGLEDMYYFNLNKSSTFGGGFAFTSFRYGKLTVVHNTDLHAFCNERLEVCKSSLENNKAYKDYKSNENYIEDYGTYSIGVMSYTTTVYGNKLCGRAIVVVTSENILLAVVVASDLKDILEFDQITKTINYNQIPDLRITNLYTNYTAYLQNPDKSQRKTISTEAAPSASQPALAQKSQVDMNIPHTNEVNDKTFAIIIANEDYQEEASVPYALNDGEVFKKYCETALGIPARNIHYRPNATLNNIRKEINWLNQVCVAYEGQANVVFYYAGHGIPDESSKASYLLPVDGSGNDVTTGYKLDDLYASLGRMPASHIVVFMDACFSGSKRESGMLASARGVALNAQAGVPKGNMVVFAASQGDETAYPNKDEGHGMFTYYLLKKLQETDGNVNLLDLSSYISTNVRQQAIVVNGKSQTPCATAANGLGTDWHDWKLK